tara:strand:- start:31 stop:213 length:183 start_codon:yes stop_codon:yes gene_type:complete
MKSNFEHWLENIGAENGLLEALFGEEKKITTAKKKVIRKVRLPYGRKVRKSNAKKAKEEE